MNGKNILIFIIFNFFCATVLLSETIFTFHWSPSEKLPENIIALNNWEMTGSSQKIQAPFFINSQRALDVQCRFTLPQLSDSQEVFFRNNGLPSSAEIFLNGTHIGFISDDFTPSELRLPAGMLKAKGQNRLRLKLFQPQSVQKGFPHFVRLFSEAPYNGLLRPLYLEIRNKNRITRFHLKTVINGKQILVRFNYVIHLYLLPSQTSTQKITVNEKITTDQLRVVYKKKAYFKADHQKISREFLLDKRYLWSVDQPQMLHFSFTVKQGRTLLIQKKFKSGLRVLKYKNHKIYLNQKALLIKGLNYHFYPLRLKKGNYKRLINKNFSWIKENGFNAVRLPRYVPDEIMLQLADSLGLLIFAELPIWRYPAGIFTSDELLEQAKTSLKNIARFLGLHPSLSAVGLGRELPLQNAGVQKFMFILKENLQQQQLNVLSYLSPIPRQSFPPEKTADLYLLDVYHSLQNELPKSGRPPLAFDLAGQLGIQEFDRPTSKQKKNNLAKEIQIATAQLRLNGGFVSSFQDWNAAYFTSETINENSAEPVMACGFFNLDGNPKKDWQDLSRIWESSAEKYIFEKPQKKNNNTFSILIVFATLLFYGVYRKRARMRENLHRSLHHPYGFFVDMRERRIIPILNSFMIGGFAALIMAVIFASFFYFYRDSYILQEIMTVFLSPLHWFNGYLRLVNNPILLSLFFFGLFFIYPISVSIILKFIGFFGEKNVRYRQALVIALWSGLPLIFLFPVSLVNYYLLIHYSIQNYLIILFIFFILWAHYRILNGIRVLLDTKMRKVFILLLLSYIIPFIIFWAVLKPAPYMIDYLNLLFQAGPLF